MDSITQALDMHRGKGKNDYFHLFPVVQDAGCKGRWTGADDQWTKLWWKTSSSPLTDITMAVENGATGASSSGSGLDQWADWKKLDTVDAKAEGDEW